MDKIFNVDDFTWPNPRLVEWVRDFVSVAQANRNVISLILIGSIVKGYQPYDVDLLAITRHKARLTEDLPIDVDLRAYPADELDELLASGHELLGWGIKFGIPLIDKCEYWQNKREHWISRIQLPSADASKERARKAYQRIKALNKIGDDDAAFEQKMTFLTHVARSKLIKHGIYPESRPQLPDQLRRINYNSIACKLEMLLTERQASYSAVE